MPTGSFDPNNLDAALDEAVKYASGSSRSADGSSTRGSSRSSARDGGRDAARDVARSAGRDAVRDTSRDATRESSRDAGPERSRESSRESSREPGRDGARRSSRDGGTRPEARSRAEGDPSRARESRRALTTAEADATSVRSTRSLFASARSLAAAAGERLSHLSSSFSRTEEDDPDRVTTAGSGDVRPRTERPERPDRAERRERRERPVRIEAGAEPTQVDFDPDADTESAGADFAISLPEVALDVAEQMSGAVTDLDASHQPGSPESAPVVVPSPEAGAAENPAAAELPPPKMVMGPDGELINARLIKPIDKQRLPPGKLLARAGDLLSSAGGGRTVFIVISMYRSDRLLALGQEASSREVMIEVVRRIRSILRPHDRYAIASHEEVWMLLADLPSASLAELAVRTLQQSLARPIHARTAEDKETVVQLRPAVGAAWSSEAGKIDSMILLSAASEAARAADKTEERVCISKLETAEAILNRNTLEQDLRHALQNNELEVHFQPQIELSSMRCVAVEALIRWTNSEHGPISPSLIATLCEERGMMAQLTHFVLNTTLRHMMFWRGQNVNVNVAINISALSLADPTFPTQVAQALSTWGADPRRLTLELTESSIVQNERAALEFMSELARMGCRLSIDDFGTGYSSLAYLRQFPLNELKIDKTFVRHLSDGRGDQRIVQVLVDLAHTFGMRALAEGVETDAGVDLLQQLGCDLAQGYLYSRPLPAKDFLIWHRERETAIAEGRVVDGSGGDRAGNGGTAPAIELRDDEVTTHLPPAHPNARTLFGTGHQQDAPAPVAIGLPEERSPAAGADSVDHDQHADAAETVVTTAIASPLFEVGDTATPRPDGLTGAA